MTAKTEPATSGVEILIPLNKLKKSPRNARKTPHSEAIIEAYAASIAAKGILQNLVVEPELDAAGEPTGSYFVTIGEGRRLAQLLRVKRKQIKKTEPIRCIIDTANDPHEISLDENITREAMHPADQFDAFRRLNEQNGWGAEEIAARFGVTPQVVRQRLRLGAVSPRLMQVYREGGLSLDQLMAFAITEDHARQEQVHDNLSWNKEPAIIRRAMTEGQVPASDRRAVFVGAEAYAEAGGAILRDLFSEDGGGYFEDAALLDRLASEKLAGIAAEVQAEGWKWAQAFLDYPHAHGLQRCCPAPVELSASDRELLNAAQAEFEALSKQYDGAEELPDEVDAKFGELEKQIELLSARQHAYDPEMMARGGVLVALSHDGSPRIERGLLRPEDEPRTNLEPDAEAGGDGPGTRTGDQQASGDAGTGDDDDGDDGKPLPDSLVRDLTAHRTLGLRLALGEQPDVALIAITHALVAQTFRRGHADRTCLDLRATTTPLGTHADGIDDTSAARALAARHERWAMQVPQDAGDLWGFVLGLDLDSRMSLLAHCCALTVFAVKQPWEGKSHVPAAADRLAEAVALDMTTHWAPTARTYLGRVTKAHITAAVREGVSGDAAERIAGMKKEPMAEAAEQLLAGTGWLPVLLRTPAATKEADRYSAAAE